MTITDVAGREVTFDKQPERIVLGEGRGLFATSILNREDPLANIVAVGKDLHQAAPSFESKFAETNAAYKDLPTIGNIAKGDVTVENLLAQKPDVVVMTLDHKKGAEKTGFLDKMDQAGLKYVFTDFRQKPLENTPKSMEVFGQLLGQEDKAAEFNKFYTGKVDDIKSRAEKAGNKPRTLVWRAAGLKDCCSTVKDSNLGDLVNAAGGENLGDSLLDTESGDLTAEKVLAEQPEHIIATGGAWAKDPESRRSCRTWRWVTRPRKKRRRRPSKACSRPRALISLRPQRKATSTLSTTSSTIRLSTSSPWSSLPCGCTQKPSRT